MISPYLVALMLAGLPWPALPRQNPPPPRKPDQMVSIPRGEIPADVSPAAKPK